MRIRSMAQHVSSALEVDPISPAASAGERTWSDVLLTQGDPRVHGLARAAFDPDDPLSRMARSVRGAIAAFAAQGGKGSIRSVAVMGLDASTEASILAANLAITYAQFGAQTVLVEANTAGGLQRTLLNTKLEHGLFEILNGDGDPRSMIEPSAISGLSIVTTGATRDGGMMLLDGERFHRRAKPLLDAFAMMVVDVGMAFNEPPTMCEALDAAVVVVRRDVTAVEDLRRLRVRLEEMNTPVVCSVVAT